MDQDLRTDFQSADDFLASYDITGDNKETPIVPFIGLKNLGNTCFFNSVIQILHYCPGFRSKLCIAAKEVETLLTGNDLNRLISEQEVKCIFSAEEAKGRCDLLLELKRIFDSMDENQMLMLNNKDGDDCTSFRAVKPENLMKYLRDLNPVFEPYTQQDAQECLQSILGMLRDALSLASRKFIGDGDGNVVVDINDNRIGCKLFGGRKLDPSKRETSSENRMQIENRDPNHVRRKKSTRIVVKKELKFSFGKPLQDKRSQEILNQTQHTNKSLSLKPRDDKAKKNKNSQNSQESSGCFPKLRRKRKPEFASDELDGRVSWSTEVMTSAVSPPFKRKRLDTLSIKDPCKPAKMDTGRGKVAEKNRLFSGFKTGKHKNPFKVLPKSNPCALSKYSLLDGNSTTETKSQVGAVKCSSHSEISSISETVNESVQPKKAKNSSDFIEQLFQGQLVNKIKCMECENSQRKTESFMEISLPVRKTDRDTETTTSTTECSTKIPAVQEKDHCSVLWGLSEFTCREILDGTNKYHCNDCRRYGEGEKSVQFSSLPPILTLHLKRFTASKTLAGGDLYNTTMVSKINTSLDVPLKLCLKDWCENTCKERHSSYKLFGIVVHSGVTISSGHYLSYIRLTKSSHQGKKLSKVQVDQLSVYWGSWLETDDERTRILSEEEVIKLLTHNETEGISRTPYLLFYERNNET